MPMNAADPSLPALTAALVRRPKPFGRRPAARERMATGASALSDDVRLFAVAWAAGFLFFMIYLS